MGCIFGSSGNELRRTSMGQWNEHYIWLKDMRSILLVANQWCP